MHDRSKEELIALINAKDSQINSQASQLDLQTSKINTQTSKINTLEFQLKELRRLIFGTKRERFIAAENPFQQKLPFEEIQEQEKVEVETEEVKFNRKKKENNHQGRLSLPDHLEVKETIIEPDVDTTGMICIGKEITDQLEFNPGSLFIQRTIRPKYALSKNKQDQLIESAEEKSSIIIADLPSLPIERCMAGTGLLTQILVDKFIDHLPYYRQIERYKREGVHIKSSTIDGWQRQLADLLDPLYQKMVNKVIAQGYIQADESPLKVMDKTKKVKDSARSGGKTHQGYHWLYHSPIEKVVIFDYRKGRTREGPKELLKDFKGYLQTDAYSAYDYFNDNKDVIRVGCMAHARRYFEKALDNDQSRAEYALTEIQKLYVVERKAREENFSHEKRHTYRLDHAQPILENLVKWLFKEKTATLPGDSIYKAINYALNNWDYLKAYLYDGAVEIDNNLIENAVRPLAIGRKNYLFAGSHNGAKRAAMFYSFFGTCKKNNVNPYQWLKATLDVIADTKTSQLENLMPQNFIA
jgi:transposase